MASGKNGTTSFKSILSGGARREDVLRELKAMKAGVQIVSSAALIELNNICTTILDKIPSQAPIINECI